MLNIVYRMFRIRTKTEQGHVALKYEDLTQFIFTLTGKSVRSNAKYPVHNVIATLIFLF